MNNPFDLTGRTALITGATRGIGRSIADRLAAAGADIIVTSRKPDACEKTAAEITATGRTAYPLPANVNRWSECDDLVSRAYETVGRIDILVNNAGSSLRYDTVDTISEELFDKTIALNLKGPFRLSALIGSRMVADGGGCIVNISDDLGTSRSRSCDRLCGGQGGLEQRDKVLCAHLRPNGPCKCHHAWRDRD